MMRRSTSTNNDQTNHQTISKSTDLNHHPTETKRSLEDYGFSANLKKRRHLSPQNTNIEPVHQVDVMPSPANRKRKRSKSKTFNASFDVNQELNSVGETQTPRKASTRHMSASSSQQFAELNLPSWERICPNIDQILSNKHTQSGVFAHEVQLVQQEIEALLSMSIVRETIVKDLHHPPTINADHLRSKIRKHQEAERVYSSKKPSKKSLAPLINQSQNRQSNPAALLDRQVTIAPIVGARIDRIWSDLNTFYHQISSNEISTIENLVEFHSQLKSQLEEFQQGTTEPSSMIEQLNDIDYEPLREMIQTPAVITHYLDRTTLGTFQTKLYEHIGQTSPVYRTPISSPMHGRLLINNNNTDSKEQIGNALRISPRLHPNEFANQKNGVFALPSVLKQEEDLEGNSSIKSKKKMKFLSSPSSAIKFQQRLQYVQNYLTDQHVSNNETVKRQLFVDGKSTKKRKTSTTTSTGPDLSNDPLQTKISTLISLVHECFLISSSALTRARLQSNHEDVWLRLLSIENEIQSLVEKLDTPTAVNNPNAAMEKAFQNLSQLLNDWKKIEDEFDEQFQQLFNED